MFYSFLALLTILAMNAIPSSDTMPTDVSPSAILGGKPPPVTGNVSTGVG